MVRSVVSVLTTDDHFYLICLNSAHELLFPFMTEDLPKCITFANWLRQERKITAIVIWRTSLFLSHLHNEL